MGCTAWEGAAGSLLAETGADDPPQDAFRLAACCGLKLRPGSSVSSGLRGGVIHYPARARLVRQHGVIAHELGHFCLDRYEEQQSEAGANYIAGALMLPRRAFDRDLTQTEWNLQKLRAKHVNASAEMIARRIVELRDAVATIFDHGKVSRRVTSPWLSRDIARVTKWESTLADMALETEQQVRGDTLVWALPVIDGLWRRVVVVAEAEQLSLRI